MVLLRLLVVLVAGTVLAAGRASAIEALVLYPVADRATREASADVQALLHVALENASRSSGTAVAALTREACGRAPVAKVDCLARLAGDGLLVRARVDRGPDAIGVALEAVDASGRIFGPLQVSIDPYVQTAAPLTRAILELASRAERAGPAPARPPLATPPLATPPLATRPPAPAPAPRPSPSLAPRPPPPTPTAAKVAPAARGAGQRTVGRWLVTGGLAALAGGGALHLANRRDAGALERSYRAGTLTPADRARYDRVDRRNTITTALLVGGGALTLAGTVTWTLAPGPGSASVTLSGSF